MSNKSESFIEKFGAPVLAVCGFSGSGKTTLLEAAIPHLVARGLSVAAIKHDSHGFEVDKEGKDSARLFRAGATVALRGPSGQFERRAATSMLTLQSTLSDLARDHDLLLVEGHKDTPLPKLWVGNTEATSPPENVSGIQEILPWNCDRLKIFLNLMDTWLPKAWVSRPLMAGLFISGKSSLTERPNEPVLRDRASAEAVACALRGVFRVGETAVANESLNLSLVLLGAGVVPESLAELTRLPHPPGLAGEIAGLVAAHRWAPNSAWVVAPCDDTWLSASEVESLLYQRRPGVWAIIPRQANVDDGSLFGLYEPQALTALERALLVRGSTSVRITELLDGRRIVFGSRKPI